MNFEIALELLTMAAEQGVVEAAGKLVEMCRTGFGVKRDYMTAIKWQKRKIELLEKICQMEPGFESCERLFDAYVYCGDIYKDRGEMEQAKDLYESAWDCVKKFHSVMKKEGAERSEARYYERLGAVCEAEEKLAERIN